MKKVTIIRAEKGNEEEAARRLEEIYNAPKDDDKVVRPGRAIITAAGDDVIYTIFSDVCEKRQDKIADDKSESDTIDADEDAGSDDEDDYIPFC